MDINAGIIDQRVSATAERLREDLIARLGPTAKNDPHRVKSGAFTLLCLQGLLAIDEDAALDALTDGSDDAGVDAIHVGDVVDNEFLVTLAQSKYSKSTDGTAGYPANAIVRIIATIRKMFDPGAALKVNERLEEQIAEVRSLILDGNLPDVRVLLCNNGRKWESNGQREIDESGLAKHRVTFQHVNHDLLIELLQKKKVIDARIGLSGKAVVEEFDYRRVMVGRVPVVEVKKLFDTHGDTLLDRNIRRYLGLKDKRVNLGIHNRLVAENRRGDFYFIQQRYHRNMYQVSA
jgi:hypothetical protein